MTAIFREGRRLGLCRLFWLFLAGCLLGVLVESLWCFVSRGYWASRSGLVWGPFNLVYGLGALAMTLGLDWTLRRGPLWTFLGGVVLGDLFEYACSWVQEVLFGTVSWQYDVPGNLNGRINPIYSLFWGILALAWLRLLCPRLLRLLDRPPRWVMVPLTWVLAAFMACNTLLSAAAVDRWAERRAGLPPESAADLLLDRRFGDRRMERIYPNMIFLTAPSAGPLKKGEICRSDVDFAGSFRYA